MPVSVSIEHLTKTIPVGFLGRRHRLLDDVSLEVPDGSVFGLVGANGAGKSTLLRLLLGAARPTTGTVRVFGGSPQERRTRRRIGYSPDIPVLPQGLTPRDHLTLCAALAEAPAGSVERVLSVVEMTAEADTRMTRFSKGMLQRVSLASALLAEPPLLVLDEPMSGLDPPGRALVRRIIRDAAARSTIIFSSHVLSDVEELCSHLAVIQAGRVVRSGRLREVIGDRVDGHLVTARFPLQHEGWGLVAPELYEKRVAPGTSLRELIADVESAGGRIVSIDTLRPSLEDVVFGMPE